MTDFQQAQGALITNPINTFYKNNKLIIFQ